MTDKFRRRRLCPAVPYLRSCYPSASPPCESRAGVAQLAGELAAQGADVLLAGAQAPGATLLPTAAAHPVIEPLLLAQSFYRMANALSLARGRDPDRPPNLSKVTETV